MGLLHRALCSLAAIQLPVCRSEHSEEGPQSKEESSEARGSCQRDTWQLAQRALPARARDPPGCFGQEEVGSPPDGSHCRCVHKSHRRGSAVRGRWGHCISVWGT